MTNDHEKHPERASPPEQEPEKVPAHAVVKKARWRGWIWAVPLAAVILVGYLMIRTWLLSGPKVTLTFPTAEGISAQGIPVLYRGIKVGDVDDVALTQDGQSVNLTLSMHSDATKFLRSGTRFWIVEPDILSGNVSQALAGAYIAMRPGPGEKTRKFTGSSGTPPLTAPGPGKTVNVVTDDASGVTQGSSVLYRGHDAGEVLEVSYDTRQDQLQIEVFVGERFANEVTPHSRFWRAGGIHLSTTGAGLEMPPLEVLLKGGIAFGNAKQNDDAARPPSTASGTPEETPRKPVEQLTFKLYESQDAARNALTGPAVLFTAQFAGTADGLKSGAPVDLQGVKVGEVRKVDLQYDAAAGELVTPVTLALYPERFGIKAGGSSQGHRTAAAGFAQVVAVLVKKGLRAQAGSSNPLFGSPEVSLVMEPKAESATLDLASRPPRIPSIRGDNLNRILASLHNAVDSAGAAATNISKLTGDSMGRENDLPTLVNELTRAARSVRELADYLQRHPESLIQGRKGQ